jgi:hypothetical protein
MYLTKIKILFYGLSNSLMRIIKTRSKKDVRGYLIVASSF